MPHRHPQGTERRLLHNHVVHRPLAQIAIDIACVLIRAPDIAVLGASFGCEQMHDQPAVVDAFDADGIGVLAAVLVDGASVAIDWVVAGEGLGAGVVRRLGVAGGIGVVGLAVGVFLVEVDGPVCGGEGDEEKRGEGSETHD